MPSRILTTSLTSTRSNDMPLTVKHPRCRLALLCLQFRAAILAFPLLLLLASSAEIRSQTADSSLPTAALSTERKVQPEIVVREQTTKLVLADASPNKAATNPRSGSGGPSFLKRVVLFPLRLMRAIASSFGEGEKPVVKAVYRSSILASDSRLIGLILPGVQGFPISDLRHCL